MRRLRNSPRALVLVLLILGAFSSAAFASTITYFSMWNSGEPQAKVLKKVISDFEQQTGNTVKVTWSGRDVLTTIRPRLLTGNAPDLVDQSFSELYAALLAQQELATPLNGLLAGNAPDGSGTFASIFDSKLMSMWKTNGNEYFVPYEYITSGFFYNKTIFDKQGIQVPKTWDELMAASAKLKAAGIAPFEQDNTGDYNNYWYYWAVERTLGPGALLKAAQDKTGATWDDPGYLKAAQMVYEASPGGKDYFEKDMKGSTWPAAQTSWAQGNGAMILVGSWIVNEVAPSSVKSWVPGYFPFPVAESGGPSSMEAYLIGFAVPKGSKNPTVAEQFIRFALQKKYQDMISTDALNIAARSGVSYPKPIADIQPYVANATAFNIPYDKTQALLPQWYGPVFTPLSTKLMLGQVTPEEFISQLKSATVNYWKQH